MWITTVWHVLHEQQLHPYHPQKVHAMQPQDFVSWAHFCRWFLEYCVEEPKFLWKIQFTDEAQFHQGSCYQFTPQSSVSWLKPACCTSPWVSGTIQSEHLGSVPGWMCDWAIPSSTKSHRWRILVIPCRCTAWALGRCATACASKHMVSARWCTISFFTCGPTSSGPTIWATVDRSWWPDCLEAHSPNLTPLDYYLWGHMKSLIFETLMASEEDWLAVVGRPRIGHRVYQNMVWRYRMCCRRDIEPFL